MNFKLEQEFSKADILKQVDDLRKQIDGLRPLPADVEGRVMQKLRLDWNYNSNAIEGNKLSYGETVAFLMEGITAKGKPLKDHLDIRGHNEAINFLLKIVKDTRRLSEADIRALHTIILVEPYDSPARTADGQPTTKRITLGEYKTSPNHVKTSTGEIHYYATPEETPAKMQELMEWYNQASASTDIHPVVLAALFHHRFVAIHPFDDGNGRLSRILMNLIVMQKGYPPVVVKMDDRSNYYSLLSRADRGDGWPFVEHMVERQLSSLQLYSKAVNGGSIDEDEDIDKEIALINLQLKGNAIAEIFKNRKTILENFEMRLFPFALKIIEKLKPFETSFFNVDKYIDLYFGAYGIFHEYELNEKRLNFDPNKLSSYLIELSDENNDYWKIKFIFNYLNYKGPINPFSLKCVFEIKFEDYTYDIFDESERLLFSKLYHEPLTTSDFKIFITEFIEKLKTHLE